MKASAIHFTARNESRFWANVDKSGDCWIWKRRRSKTGYGLTDIQDSTFLAHRVAFTMTNGPIPDGQVIDHRCHVHACVNPSHLRAVTQKQNSENAMGASKSSRTKVRGVYWDKETHRFRAQITHFGRKIHVGNFESLDAAECAVTAERNRTYTHNDLDRMIPA